MIIDGKKIAGEIYEELQREIEELSNQDSRSAIPTLGAILVGNNSASLKYIAQKRKFSAQIGMGFELLQLDINVSEEDVLKSIDKWNKSEVISGYIIQLPLPKHINSTRIIEAIDPKKDVDGFHSVSQGKILIGDTSGLVSCTPAGVMKILKFESLPFHSIPGTPFDKGKNNSNIFLSGKKAVVIGKSNIVGKPVVALLINAGATVTSCNSKTPDLKEFTKNADIVIVAAGVPGLLTLDHINDKTVVIDVGFTIVDGKIRGDADFDSIHANGNLITPVPGGVGRLTVACLLQNTLQAFKQNMY